MKEFRDISGIVSRYMCSSCGACYTACGFDAIRYRETIGGYFFPEIDYEACTHCGLCAEVCPGAGFGKGLGMEMPKDPFSGEIMSCMVGRASDEKIFRNAQSGGVVTALLNQLFLSGLIDAAVTTVMKTGVPPRGEVLLAEKPEDLFVSQKSKYTPVPVLKVLKEVEKRKLRIAFVGLSCHMHGLMNLMDLKPDLKELVRVKIGLVCEHILTTSAIDYFGSKATTSPFEYFVFKDKNRSKYPGNPVITEAGGRQIQIQDSLRKRAKDFFTPLRCRLCFDKLNIFADLTAGDPHGLEGIDRIGGESLVFVRTDTGRRLLNLAMEEGSLEMRPVDCKSAVEGQGIRRKKRNWADSMQAWKDMGKPVPVYSFSFPFEQTSLKGRRQAGIKLRQSMKLDQVKSRELLYVRADKKLRKDRLKKRIRSFMKNIIRRRDA